MNLLKHTMYGLRPVTLEQLVPKDESDLGWENAAINVESFVSTLKRININIDPLTQCALYYHLFTLQLSQYTRKTIYESFLERRVSIIVYDDLNDDEGVEFRIEYRWPEKMTDIAFRSTIGTQLEQKVRRFEHEKHLEALYGVMLRPYA